MSRGVSPADIARVGWRLDPAGIGAHVTNGHFRINRWNDYVSRIIAEDFAKGGS